MRKRVLFLVIALAVVAGGCGGGGEDVLEDLSPVATRGAPAETPSRPQPGGMPEAEGEDSVLSMDAIPGEPIDATRTVSGDAPFEVDIVVAEVSGVYKGVQFKLEWDPGVLSYVDLTYHNPTEYGFCPLPVIQDGAVYGGCAGQISVLFTGALATVKLRCIGGGSSPLHLVTLAEDRDFGTGVALQAGLPFPATFQDASITCE